MADELNKDVVGARISLDTSKMLQSFKTIDEGARGNAESFKQLNAELSITQKNYTAIASAADKVALSSEERRRKILAESEALVKQRTAQAELLTAKKQQLDQTNNLVDAKLQSQQAIIKKREASIEQQEREHQQRMLNLQQKNESTAQVIESRLAREQQALKSGQTKIEQQVQQHQQKMALLEQKTMGASAQENLVQAKIDRQFQLIKNGNRKLEMEQERHAARMNKMVNADSILDRSSQYMLSGTMYYAVIRRATEAISVLKDFEYELVNIKRIMGDTADVEFVKESMISNAKEYGYALTEVAEVYTLIAQQGFDERQTESLARTALMAANVEQSFQSAAQAQEMMTGAILNYGMAAEDSEALLDKLNEVSNQYPTTSKKLLEGINRVGAAAKNAGVDIDELIGYLTVLNQSGFTGSVAGNAIKSFISFSSRDIAVDKLEKYVGVMKQANGDMMDFSELLGKIAEKWQTYSDVERTEITQAIARGDQASRFIALMNNYNKTMDVATTAQNSFGSAQRENALAMTTLEKQSLQLKAAWDELIVTIGDSGLLSVLKAMTQTATSLIDGFNSLPEPIRNTVTSVLLIGAAITALNTGTKLFTGQSLVGLVTGLVNGAKAMLGMKAATDAANVSQKAFIATPIGAVLTAVSLAIGATTVAWSYYKGEQNKVTEQTLQHNRDLSTLVSRYDQLKSIVDDNTRSDQEVTAAKQELATVIEKISGIMPGLISQWDELGKAKDVDAEKIEQWKQKYADSVKVVEQANLDAAQKRKAALEQELEYTQYAVRNASEADLSLIDKARGKTVQDLIHQWSEEIVNLGSKIAEEEQKIKNSQDALNSLNGTTKDTTSSTNNLGSAVAQSSDTMDEYGEITDDLTSAQDEQYQTTEDLVKAHENLESQIKGNSTAISELNSLSRELAEGQSLNASNATDLILKYPQLADAIYKTADGWKFETNAVDVLRKAKIQKAIDELEAEKNSALNVKLATDERLQAYGIEADAIKSLADLKAQLNGTQSDVLSTGDDLKYFKSSFRKQGAAVMAGREAAQNEINSIYAEYESEMNTYDSKIKALTGLYQDTEFGVSDSSRGGSSSKGNSGKKDDPLKKQFEASQKYIEHQKAIGRLNTQQELLAWERIQAKYKAGSEQRLQADEKVYDLRKKLADEVAKKEKEAYDASMEWILHQKGIREVSAQEELEMLLRVQARYKAGSEERMQLDEQVYAAKKAAEQESFSEFTKNLNHQKAMEQLSTEDEIKAWEKIQSMYREGTDERIQAEEQIYALKKKLMDEEQQTVTVSIQTIQSKMESAKNDAVKTIEEERDAFLSAQDAKIKAIDDQIKANDRLYVEEDYQRKLAEKQTRLEELASAVGPEGLEEREQVQKDIEDMQREHDRELAKQSLEGQKQALEDEKNQKEQDYNQQIDAANQHYEELSSAFDTFSETIEFKAEDLKQIQILKENEKNAEILAQLDRFIAEYEATMSRINSVSTQTRSGVVGGGTSLSEEDQDLNRYNNNVDKWYSGTAEEKAAAHAENEALRQKYGIRKDTGKLQHFKTGGVVRGMRGEATPVVAHAGEMYINEQQQSNLFKLLNFKMPTLNFSMPSFSLPAASGGSNPQVNNNYFTVSTGDTYIEDESTARVFWSEKDNFIRRMQSKGGGKG
ncbi:phage tail tape measure protein [Paenibacillus macerans]|uniref:phage tail tape measure protein n=1 Tax=Paenibacillus macerans TaxID=44252 RepID=UPI003D32179A